MIPVIYDDAEKGHSPDNFVVRGVRQQNKEVPERTELMRTALDQAGYELSVPEDFGMAPLKAVHTERYLDFLEHGHGEWSAFEGAAPEIIPNAFPVNPHAGYPTSIVGRAGFHMGDMACPINAGTWAAARGAANAALTATKRVMAGERAVYALCRPPGHHAFADRAAGFCFLNNGGHRGPVCPRQRRRAGCDPRCRRPSRQRHPGHILRPRGRVLRLAPGRPGRVLPVLLGLQGPDRCGRRRGLHGQLPAAAGIRRRCIPRSLGGRPRPYRQVRSGAPHPVRSASTSL